MRDLRRLCDDILRGRRPDLRQDLFTYALGLIGLVLLAQAYPFGWDMPAYAAY